MVRRPAGAGGRARTFWRIASETKANIERALTAKQWGMRRRIGVKTGDGVVFYVSKGNHAGYWGTATVTSDLFIRKSVIWPDDLYPIRFRLSPDGPVRPSPVTREQLMQRLGRQKLTFLRQAGVIRLSADEYTAISALLKA